MLFQCIFNEAHVSHLLSMNRTSCQFIINKAHVISSFFNVAQVKSIYFQGRQCYFKHFSIPDMTIFSMSILLNVISVRNWYSALFTNV